MIRFRTIEPDQVEKSAAKPAKAPAVAQASADALKVDAEAGESPAKPKGMTRKTPLRAKKAAASGHIRD